MNRKNLIRIIGITGGVTGLVNIIINNKKTAQLAEDVKTVTEQVITSVELSNQSLAKIINLEVRLDSHYEQNYEILKKATEGLNYITEGLDTLNPHLDGSKLLKTLSESKGSESFSKVMEILNNNNPKLTGDDSILNIFFKINEYFKVFYEYVNTLSLFEASMIFHILLLISIIISAINILTLFFGEYLIKLFNLELKYPKIATIIKLRRKFVNFNIFISLSYIILISLGFIITDLYAIL